MEEVNSNTNLTLEVNPVRVYCAIYEIDDNEKNSITMERALRAPNVAEIINYRLKGLEEITSEFIEAIILSLDFAPDGIRWLCKAIYQLCRKKFSEDSTENITGLIRGFFLLRFINPAIVTPHNQILLGSQPRANVRRIFVLIAKLLQCISNKGTSQILREIYKKPLEEFVAGRQKILQPFGHNLCDVDDFHSYLEIEQCLLLPKGIYISVTLREMHRLHELVCKYQDFLIENDNDKMTILLEELGMPASAEFFNDNGWYIFT